MSVCIRVDSSLQIGTGHLVRCRSLAREIVRRGTKVLFVCRELPGHQMNLLQSEGFEVRVLAEEDLSSAADEVRDAQDTLDAIAGEDVEHIVVDHYRLGTAWEVRVRQHASKLIVIDDLADRPHDCDILVDQNFFSDPSKRYRSLVPQEAKLLLGPAYAIVDRSYIELEPRVRTTVERVLVFFGGADNDNATAIALEALSTPELETLPLDVVVGASNPHRASIEKQVAGRGNAQLHVQLPTLSSVIGGSDLAIGAGGSTTWERLRSGLPSIVVSIADNQTEISQELAHAGLIDYAGDLATIEPGELATRVTALKHDLTRLKAMSENCQVLVDGFGAARVAEAFLPTDYRDLRMRLAKLTDAAIYFRWANDATTRQHSLASEAIPWESHIAWFSQRIASDRCLMLLLLTGSGLPAGQIRFDLSAGGIYRLSYSLDSVVRGRGLAKHLVAMGIKQLAHRGNVEILAEVKQANRASIRVFEELGFRLETNLHELRTYRTSTASKGMQQDD